MNTNTLRLDGGHITDGWQTPDGLIHATCRACGWRTDPSRSGVTKQRLDHAKETAERCAHPGCDRRKMHTTKSKLCIQHHPANGWEWINGHLEVC
ncbi:MAG: hypothetical protein J2P17_01350 [Mycobacterium sp.]|nr:hypothetical protein [Mycobacterium sp.]